MWILFLITGSLDGSRSLNPGKIERYLALAQASNTFSGNHPE